MTNQIVFPSLERPAKHGYVLNKDSMKYWDQMRRCGSAFFVDGHAGMFDTYGDGLVQHSPDMAMSISNLQDYCLSLSTYLLSHPQHMAFAGDCLRGACCPETPKWRELIPFLAKLRYDETKPFRWYSVDYDNYCKVSSSESKRHDKRWSEIPSNADGSSEFIWNKLAEFSNGDTCDGALRSYCYRMQFEKVCRYCDVWVSQRPHEYLGLPYSVHGSVLALQALVVSAVNLEYARKTVENILENIEAAKAAEEVA